MFDVCSWWQLVDFFLRDPIWLNQTATRKKKHEHMCEICSTCALVKRNSRWSFLQKKMCVFFEDCQGWSFHLDYITNMFLFEHLDLEFSWLSTENWILQNTLFAIHACPARKFPWTLLHLGISCSFLWQWEAGRWFQIFFIFTPIWGRFPIWLMFFRWVESTNQKGVFNQTTPSSRILQMWWM